MILTLRNLEADLSVTYYSRNGVRLLGFYKSKESQLRSLFGMDLVTSDTGLFSACAYESLIGCIVSEARVSL